MRRELKKLRTRTALVDAALDLFLKKGYEATTIDEIVASVQVSQRTFFRYFATKEDVVTGFFAEYDEVMRDALAARPPEEGPLTALHEAMRAVLAAIARSDAEDSTRFRRVRQVIEATPALVAAQLARHAEAERELAALVAERLGTDPDQDVWPRLLVAFHTAAARVAFEDCARHDVWDPVQVAARVDAVMGRAREELPRWT